MVLRARKRVQQIVGNSILYLIADFVSRYRQYVVAVVLVIVSFLLMSLGNAADLRGFRTVVIGGIGIAQSLFSWIPNPVALRTENIGLRELNSQLSKEVVKTRRALIENDRLRAMLDFKSKVDYPVVAAEVVGKTATQMRSYITINVGEKKGITKSMAVLTDRGLVGHVVNVSPSFALVQLLINRDTRVAAKVERSRVDGIIMWEGGDYLLMKNIAKSQDVKPGDMVVSSGYSNIYPSDVYIGKVVDVREEGNSLFRQVFIEPAVNFNTIEQVFVKMEVANEERIELEKTLEKKIQQSKK